MNLHEYQAKQLLARYQLPVPHGVVLCSQADAEAFQDGGKPWVLKAQIHAGGRGKAGGVRVVKNKAELMKAVSDLLGKHLVTYQTNAKGQPVNTLWLEEPSNIARELYLGALIDRASKRMVIMASTEGGMDIEKVAHETPEKIHTLEIDPVLGVLPFQGRLLAFRLGLQGELINEFSKLLQALGKMFTECDLSLIEINPLVITKEGKLMCLDGKIAVDDNALYRQKTLADLRDADQEDERERRAREWDLNYIALDGNIGCMVNGAGLAMATMDLVKLYGGSPANFLDVGGGATQERVAEAFKIILSDEKVRAILVNIFGGIVRCDLIAEGIIGAVKEVSISIPVVVRLEGNNATLGADMLSKSGLNITAAKSFKEAAKLAVDAVGK